MRVLAHLSGDSNLCDLFYQSGDIYYLLAGKLFSKPISEITDDERHQSKVICLGRFYFTKFILFIKAIIYIFIFKGIIYGMGVSSVASKLQLDFNAATAITNAFFGKFRQVQNWIANIKSYVFVLLVIVLYSFKYIDKRKILSMFVACQEGYVTSPI